MYENFNWETFCGWLKKGLFQHQVRWIKKVLKNAHYCNLNYNNVISESEDVFLFVLIQVVCRYLWLVN